MESWEDDCTGIGLNALGDGHVSIITGVEEDYSTNGTMILSILDLETTEQTTVLDKGDLALDLDTELNKSVEVIN